MKWLRTAFVVLLVLVGTGIGAPTALGEGRSEGQSSLLSSTSATQQQDASPLVAENRLIVTFRNTASAAQVSRVTDAVRRQTGSPDAVVSTRAISPLSIVVETGPGQRDTVMATYQKQPGVLEIVPDILLKAQATPNDPLLSQQTYLTTINAQKAWDISRGAGVKIAILDSGIYDHPELSSKILAAKDASGFGLAPVDTHGTHVAGPAAAAYNNSIGIAGVAGEAVLLNCKIGQNGVAGGSAIMVPGCGR